MQDIKKIRHYQAQMRGKKQTPAERLFHYRLKQSDLGEFKRQVIVGFYIVDFVFPARMLVIEIDGCSHDGRERYDERRDKFLRSMGFSVMHIQNAAASTFDLSEIAAMPLAPETMPTRFNSALGQANAQRGLALQKERAAACGMEFRKYQKQLAGGRIDAYGRKLQPWA
jgi:very-short-patch-repair endonuclease